MPVLSGDSNLSCDLQLSLHPRRQHQVILQEINGTQNLKEGHFEDKAGIKGQVQWLSPSCSSDRSPEWPWDRHCQGWEESTASLEPPPLGCAWGPFLHNHSATAATPAAGVPTVWALLSPQLSPVRACSRWIQPSLALPCG